MVTHTQIKFQISDRIVFNAVIKEDGDNYTLYLDKSIGLSKHYEELFFSIINGKYSITYVKDGKDLTDYFDFGHPIKNIKKYALSFAGLPLKIIILEEGGDEVLVFDDFTFNPKDIHTIDFKYKEAI